MASIRKAKKMGTYVPRERTKAERELLKETRELASQVNRRLKGLKQAGYKGTWASKKLINRIDTDVLKGWQGGKVKVGKDLTSGQLKNLQKATKQFLVSKTSKASGIEKAKKSTLESLKGTLSNEDIIKNEEDIETAYNMLSDKDFDYFNNKDRVGASTLWVLIDDAIEQGQSEKTFVDLLVQGYESSNDLDARERAKRLYEKYVL